MDRPFPPQNPKSWEADSTTPPTKEGGVPAAGALAGPWEGGGAATDRAGHRAPERGGLGFGGTPSPLPLSRRTDSSFSVLLRPRSAPAPLRPSLSPSLWPRTAPELWPASLLRLVVRVPGAQTHLDNPYRPPTRPATRPT